MPVTAHTFAERPDLAERGVPSSQVWPEYNLHSDVVNPYWSPLLDNFSDFQAVLYDAETDVVVGELHTGPMSWDGHETHLPSGIDAAIRAVVDGRGDGVAETLCAFAVEISPDARGRGLAEQALLAMSGLAERHGLSHLVAPVRPSWKERYPLTPIEEYVLWRRADGLLLDPWLRIHERVGGRLATPLPRSMLITGTLTEWESWVGIAFPRSGEYVFPGGLALLDVDVQEDLGTYWEPNVWVVHAVTS
jgi:hypothetical protein